MCESLNRVRMKDRAGSLKVVCLWMLVVLLQGLDAECRAPKTDATGVFCSLKQLAALTRSLIEASLKSYEEANGKHLGTWQPGFPELQVHHDSLLVPSSVQCSLLFMAQGVKEVLEDQRSNLNPLDVSLLKTLQDSVSYISMLNTCVKRMLKGDCSTKPLPPKMPVYVFERKQWSHTFLKTAKCYLKWLEHHVHAYVLKGSLKNDIKCQVTNISYRKYVRESRQLL